MNFLKRLEEKIEVRTRPKFPVNDPWKRLEMERYHPFFRFWTGAIKGLCPGLGYATVAFAIYCVYDSFTHKHH